MTDQTLRNELNLLGNLVTGKVPVGAPSTLTVEQFLDGKMFYCSHDGGYTRFRYEWLYDPSVEGVGLIKLIWNADKGNQFNDRVRAWEGIHCAVLRVSLEKKLAELILRDGKILSEGQ